MVRLAERPPFPRRSAGVSLKGDVNAASTASVRAFPPAFCRGVVEGIWHLDAQVAVGHFPPAFCRGVVEGGPIRCA